AVRLAHPVPQETEPARGDRDAGRGRSDVADSRGRLARGFRELLPGAPERRGSERASGSHGAQAGAPEVKPVAIVPVAGAGTRLRPHTHTTPKALLLVAGKTILAHILDQIVPVSPEKVILVIAPGALGERIRDYASSRKDLRIECVVQEEPKGLGHAVAQARHAAGKSPLLIILGDTIVQADLAALIQDGSRVGVREVDDPRRFGVALAREGVVVLPPVAMDPTADVSAAVIGPHVSIGPRTQVRQAVVRNSILNEGANVRDILLEGSVVGENAVVRGAYQRLNVGDSSEVE